MRDRRAYFAVAVAGAAMLLAGTTGVAGDRTTPAARQAAAPPTLKSCRVGDYEFSVTSGPSFVPCDSAAGQCTEIEYTVSPSRRVVYVLEGRGVVAVSGDGTIFDACVGVGSFGRGSCHEQAVATTPDDLGRFKVTLAGQRQSNPTSVATDADTPQACPILGIGLENEFPPDQAVQTTETVDFKGCVVEFTRDRDTGDVVKAQLLQEVSRPDCEGPSLDPRTGIIEPRPVTALEVKLKDGTSLGKGKFGDGYISTGNESCTTRVIGGKVYTWGKPCP